MRVLFSCTATEGHVAPLVPLARAFADLGHEVAFATATTFEAPVRSDGFRTLVAGLDQAQIKTRMQEYRPRLLRLPPAERRPAAYTWRFAHIDAPAKLPELARAAKAWRPELLVHDAAELCAPPVAASLDIPCRLARRLRNHLRRTRPRTSSITRPPLGRRGLRRS